MKTRYPAVQRLADRSFKGQMTLVEQHQGFEIWHCITRDSTEYHVIQVGPSWSHYMTLRMSDIEVEHDEEFGHLLTPEGREESLKQARLIGHAYVNKTHYDPVFDYVRRKVEIDAAFASRDLDS